MTLTPGGHGGSVNESLSKFAPELDKNTAEPHVQKRIGKLGRSSFDEQHPFLLIDETAVEISVVYAMESRDVMPPIEPALLGGVNRMWLLVTFTRWLPLVTENGIERFRRPAADPLDAEEAGAE